ncbi:MAG: hypothetical protein ACFFDH_05000 [Promethearchaeota archaeon]
MSLKCYYHPERDAITKCEKCGKVICLECKMVYHVRYTSRSGNHQYTSTSMYEYCPVCFYDQQINSYGPQAKRSVGVFSIVSLVLIVIFSIFFTMASVVLLTLVLVLIPVDISIFVYNPRKIVGFEIKKAEFLKTIQPVKEEQIKELFCSECGNKLEPDISVCSYCGNVIEKFGTENQELVKTIQEKKIPMARKYIVISSIIIDIGIVFIFYFFFQLSEIRSEYIPWLFGSVFMILFILGFIFIASGAILIIIFYKKTKILRLLISNTP